MRQSFVMIYRRKKKQSSIMIACCAGGNFKIGVSVILKTFYPIATTLAIAS